MSTQPLEPSSTGLRGLGDPAGLSLGRQGRTWGLRGQRRDRMECVHGGTRTGAGGGGRRAREDGAWARRTAGRGADRTTDPRGAHRWAVGLRRSLWVRGRRRLPVLGLCGADGLCFKRTRCGRKPASPAELETGDAMAVTRQPAGGSRCARALRRGSAHAPSPPASLPAFEANDRIGRTRLRQSTARSLSRKQFSAGAPAGSSGSGLIFPSSPIGESLLSTHLTTRSGCETESA